MAALRAQWHSLGTEILVRATRGISAGSVLNADLGRAVTAARIEEWAGVLSLYEPQLSLVEPRNESLPARAMA